MEMDKVLYLKYEGRWGGYKQMQEVPHHLLMFVDEGACSYLVNGTTYVVRQGEVLFMAAHASRQGIAVGDQSHAKYSVHWKGDGMFAHFPRLQAGAVLFRTAAQQTYLRQTYTRMYQIWRRKEQYYKPLCQSMVLEVAVRIHQEMESGLSSGKQALVVQQVKDYIMEYYREPLSIEELADHAGRNPAHLVTSFRKHCGVTPIAFMHQTRIAKAEEMLLTTDANIEDIALELGYCDAAYFNRMFMRLIGMTPSAFRRLL